MLSLLDFSTGKLDRDPLLLLVDADVLSRARRLGFELRRAEDSSLEGEGRCGVQGEFRDGLVNRDGDLGRAREGQVLQVGPDSEVIVDRAVKGEGENKVRETCKGCLEAAMDGL